MVFAFFLPLSPSLGLGPLMNLTHSRALNLGRVIIMSASIALVLEEDLPAIRRRTSRLGTKAKEETRT